MRNSKFSESPIVHTLKQVEGGRQVMDVCRELGISDVTYACGSLSTVGWVSDVRRLSELEYENAKLKRMYVDLVLEVTALKDVIVKKLWVRR